MNNLTALANATNTLVQNIHAHTNTKTSATTILNICLTELNATNPTKELDYYIPYPEDQINPTNNPQKAITLILEALGNVAAHWSTKTTSQRAYIEHDLRKRALATLAHHATTILAHH